jgi:hypothetical protein
MRHYVVWPTGNKVCGGSGHAAAQLSFAFNNLLQWTNIIALQVGAFFAIANRSCTSLLSRWIDTTFFGRFVDSSVFEGDFSRARVRLKIEH